MRVVPLLILFLCGLSISVPPERLIASDLSIGAMASDDAAGQAQYQALQAQANLALDLLKQAHERRLAAARFTAN
jgi:hypothetical protein